MNPLSLAAISFPVCIILLVLIGFYKVFIKKKTVVNFYTPFDQITGQSNVEFHEEQEVLEEEKDQGDKPWQ
ncbi:DUF3951 domain-containing protein [Peribacillus alkalitolerans]|uniref:DUF3951 domain-containing protein n=1 Tax=Peribacillus alkalitolerans TaxID=1550385 RepID=UPI0013D20679|nr:DUF3951 domain-containing protein [Peribacillus alkalitolerans]